jgi:hypothetical protein
MSESIEQLSIVKLEDSLLRSKFLVTDINKSNTIPSWDGFIRLYKNEDKNRKKSNLLARIPVQVKGETNSYILIEEIKYPVKKSDLNNYLRGGGVIFFVVRMKDHDNFRIYYETLTPFKIKRFMRSKKKRESISIALTTFPQRSVVEITDVFFTFANDMNIKASDNFLSIDEFRKINPIGFDSFAMYYQGVKYKHRNPMDYFLENEVTVYAKHSGTDMIIPVDLVSVKEYVRDFDLPVLIKKTEYYSNFKSLYTKEGIKMLVGKSVSFFYPKDNENVNFNIKFQGTLTQRIKDTEFVIALLENKHFTVGGDTPHEFKLGTSDKEIDFNDKIKYYQNYFAYLINIKRFYQF